MFVTKGGERIAREWLEHHFREWRLNLAGFFLLVSPQTRFIVPPPCSLRVQSSFSLSWGSPSGSQLLSWAWYQLVESQCQWLNGFSLLCALRYQVPRSMSGFKPSSQLHRMCCDKAALFMYHWKHYWAAFSSFVMSYSPRLDSDWLSWSYRELWLEMCQSLCQVRRCRSFSLCFTQAHLLTNIYIRTS